MSSFLPQRLNHLINQQINQQLNQLRFLLVSACIALLFACGGNSGSDAQSLPNTQAPASESYSGPPPASEDVQRFRLYVWDNLTPSNRCGSCHDASGQVPRFARQDDVNLAYGEANTVVNLASPAESLLVTKVAGGHNCWLDSDAACADTLTRYVSAWASEAVDQTSTIEFTAPAEKEPGESKVFPVDSTDFANTIHPLLVDHCARCHTETAQFAQSPYFAGPDADGAYAEARNKIDLDTPDNSRLVIRLRDEFHNCWSDCGADAEAMRSAIEAFSSAIQPVAVNPEWLTSKALTLGDGLLASSGGRYDENVIALFEFKTGNGTTAYDTSGIEPALNLTLSGGVEWVGGWGLTFSGGKAQASTLASRKLHEQILATGEYSLEAWVAPASTTQEGPATIASYSAGVNARNFALGQVLYSYDFRQRSALSDANGEPALRTNPDDEDAQATLQHVVINYHPATGRKVYVNGADTGDAETLAPASLADWDNTYAFVLGNNVSGNRAWQGTLRFLAVHNRALTEEQIQTNFETGVGQRFYLLFGTAGLVDVPQSYIAFEVSQFDSYSYLFSQPFFVTLDDGVTIPDTPIAGIRIGMNGRLVTQGQAWSTLTTTLTSVQYDPQRGQSLSEIGSIIAIEKGAGSDEFFLTFDRIGDRENVLIEATPSPSPVPISGTTSADIGIRTFDEINAAMANITGVSPVTPSVATLYTSIQQQLPSVNDINTFVSSQQMAITQLAIAYCHELVESPTQRQAFFGNVDINAPPATVFTTAGRSSVLQQLRQRIIGEDLATQPDTASIDAELNALIDRLTTCGNNCASDRTASVLKSTCAALLGSATVLIK